MESDCPVMLLPSGSSCLLPSCPDNLPHGQLFHLLQSLQSGVTSHLLSEGGEKPSGHALGQRGQLSAFLLPLHSQPRTVGLFQDHLQGAQPARAGGPTLVPPPSLYHTLLGNQPFLHPFSHLPPPVQILLCVATSPCAGVPTPAFSPAGRPR